MIVKVIKIGNSLGVVLPQVIVDQCSIKDEVRLEVKGNTIVINPVITQPRQGWEAQFYKAGSLTDNELLMGEFEKYFENKEWTW